jgi:hypothetical protein
MSGFMDGGGCRTHGRRFDGCPLDQIEQFVAPQPHSLNVNERAEFREVLAAYVERDAQNRRLLAQALDQIEKLNEELAQVKATRDRYQTNGKRVNAEKREMEALLKRPDVKRALQKTLHRDAHPGASPTQLLTHDQEFIKLTSIYQRIETSQ